MSATARSETDLTSARRSLGDRLGDRGLHGLTMLAAAICVVTVGLIAYKVFDQAGSAISTFGLGFLTSSQWNPVTNQFGAADFIFGTAVTTAGALIIATPLSIAIALYLTELAPRFLRTPIATLVEMLAAIPSVVIGLWGILVMGPFIQDHLGPWLHSAFGWFPLFTGSPAQVGLLSAILVLTIMVIPIISAVTREIFATCPNELKEGALALGATRWEMVRLVMLPYARNGIVGAVILGMGRAVGEAIAVTQVIGGTAGIHASLFGSGDTLASRIASQYQGATSNIQISSIAYLGAILLVIALIANVIARLIVGGVRVGGRRTRPAVPAGAPA